MPVRRWASIAVLVAAVVPACGEYSGEPDASASAGQGNGVGTGGVSPSGGAAAGGGEVAATGGLATGGAGAGGAGAVDSGGHAGVGTGGAPEVTGPCDIYAAGDTPCVAAHSTVRSLYGAYGGSLYQVRRASDGATMDIGVLSPGGIADSGAQDSFCAGTTCTIVLIYDQSPQHNDLTLTVGGWIGDRAHEADAAGIQITVGGQPVYGIHVPESDGVTGVGYRNNQATGTATGDEPESMYMVTNGRYYNMLCCFDYGNAQTNSENNGNGTMEAIYFGVAQFWGIGDGDGPWVMADLENGVFSGQFAGALNPDNTSIIADYVTAMLKGRPGNIAIKGGDAQSGSLKTMYDGPRPDGYDPMRKEAAIILGTGGDNSFTGIGDFFEGAMTTGYASDATEDAVQANIAAAGYGL